MRFKEPKDKERIHWTSHAKEKMRFYNLSESRIKRVLRNPEREEKGLAPKTVAVMQKTGTKKRSKEIWVMYLIDKTKNKRKIKIISAWRYPGKSPIGEPPIPEDTLKILKNEKSIAY